MEELPQKLAAKLRQRANKHKPRMVIDGKSIFIIKELAKSSKPKKKRKRK